MQANTGFPHHVHWDSFQLADAVPRRLSELYSFDAATDAPATDSANGGYRRAHPLPHHYVPASILPGLFRAN